MLARSLPACATSSWVVVLMGSFLRGRLFKHMKKSVGRLTWVCQSRNTCAKPLCLSPLKRPVIGYSRVGIGGWKKFQKIFSVDKPGFGCGRLWMDCETRVTGRTGWSSKPAGSRTTCLLFRCVDNLDNCVHALCTAVTRARNYTGVTHDMGVVCLADTTSSGLK